jgi:hypothetical protein
VSGGINVSVAFDDDALTASPAWTDISSAVAGVKVSRIEIDRGRAFELDKTEAGTTNVDFVDTGGAFDPTNTLSTYAGNIQPEKQQKLELYNPVTATYHTLMRAHVADWDYDLDPSQKVFFGKISGVGPFDYLARVEMTPGNFGDTVDVLTTGDIVYNANASLDACQTRINQALDDALWPSALREIFTGNVGLQATVYARLDSVLSVLYDTADAEFPGVANIFERRDGAIVFHGRFARFNPEDVSYNINFWKAGDDAACALDSNTARISAPLHFNHGITRVINTCVALPQNGNDSDVAANVVVDTASRGEFGWRPDSFENLATANGAGPTTAVEETKLFADYTVDNYAQPRTRVEQLTFKSQRPTGPYGTAQWAFLCGVDISDVISLTTTHPGGGGFAEDFFVEGLHYIIEPGNGTYANVTLTVDVSPRAYYDTNPF